MSDNIEVFGKQVDVADIQRLLEDQFMLVSMKVRKGAQTRQDKDAARRIEAERGADKGSLKAQNNIWGPRGSWSAEQVKGLFAVAGSAYKVKEKFTRPWGMNGEGILPNADYFEFTAELGKVEAELDSMLSAMEPHYGRLVNAARASHGDIGPSIIYPEWPEFKAGIGIRTEMTKVPSPEEQSKLNVTHSIAQQIAERAVANRNEAVTELMRTTFESIAPVIERLAVQTSAPPEGKTKRRIYDTLLEEVNALVHAMSAFNITNDPAIAGLQQRLAALVSGLCTDDLRAGHEDPVVAYVHEEATQIADDLSSLGLF